MLEVLILLICASFTLYVLGIDLNPISAIQDATKRIKLRREEDLARLKGYHKRLAEQSSELLARANDLDQQSKYHTVPESWSLSVYLLCTQLVTLSEQVTMLDAYLKRGDVSSVRHQLYLSAHLAHTLSCQLNDLKKLLSSQSAQTKPLAINQ
jgi:hypothetical protein